MCMYKIILGGRTRGWWKCKVAQSGEEEKEQSRGFRNRRGRGRESWMKWDWEMTDSGC